MVPKYGSLYDWRYRDDERSMESKKIFLLGRSINVKLQRQLVCLFQDDKKLYSSMPRACSAQLFFLFFLLVLLVVHVVLLVVLQ